MNITPFLYVPFIAWAVAQFIKFSLALIRGEGNIRYLYASGGMPSVHSATVCSLATWALIDGGTGSALFGFTTVFAAIVMYDSFGVRRSAGEHAKAINKLVNDLSVSGGLKNASEYREMREMLGHKPLEVLVGAILGIVIAGCFGYQKILDSYPVIFSTPSKTAIKVLFVIGIVAVVAAPFVYIFGSKKFKKNKRSVSKITYIALTSILFGLFILVSAFLANEGISSLLSTWALIILIFIIWAIIKSVFTFQLFKENSKSKPNDDEKRKSTWINKAKKKKRKK
jgi:acid phosphatase family membrane protein YuiD